MERGDGIVEFGQIVVFAQYLSHTPRFSRNPCGFFSYTCLQEVKYDA